MKARKQQEATVLRALRLEAGLTQDQLAAEAGVSRQTVLFHEWNTGNPWSLTRRALVDTLGQHLDRKVEAADIWPEAA